MEGKRIAPIRHTIDVDGEFEPGASSMIETAMSKNIAILRKNKPDANTLIDLEIASRILLGKPVINDAEKQVALEEIKLEWKNSFQIDTTQGNFNSMLSAIDFSLLTGELIASPDTLEKLKEGSEEHANSIFDKLFNEQLEENLDDDYWGIEDFLFHHINEIADIGLIYKYLSSTSFNESKNETLDVLKSFAKNFENDIKTENIEESIKLLKIMAVILLIKASLINVSRDGKTELIF